MFKGYNTIETEESSIGREDSKSNTKRNTTIGVVALLTVSLLVFTANRNNTLTSDLSSSTTTTSPCHELSTILGRMMGFTMATEQTACHVFYDVGQFTDLHGGVGYDYVASQKRLANSLPVIVDLLINHTASFIGFNISHSDNIDIQCDCVEGCLCGTAGTCDMSGDPVCNAFFTKPYSMAECLTNEETTCYSCVSDCFASYHSDWAQVRMENTNKV